MRTPQPARAPPAIAGRRIASRHQINGAGRQVQTTGVLLGFRSTTTGSSLWHHKGNIGMMSHGCRFVRLPFAPGQTNKPI